MDNTELIKRLRQLHHPRAVREAADAIQSLEARVRELEGLLAPFTSAVGMELIDHDDEPEQYHAVIFEPESAPSFAHVMKVTKTLNQPGEV